MDRLSATPYHQTIGRIQFDLMPRSCYRFAGNMIRNHPVVARDGGPEINGLLENCNVNFGADPPELVDLSRVVIFPVRAVKNSGYANSAQELPDATLAICWRPLKFANSDQLYACREAALFSAAEDER